MNNKIFELFDDNTFKFTEDLYTPVLDKKLPNLFDKNLENDSYLEENNPGLENFSNDSKLFEPFKDLYYNGIILNSSDDKNIFFSLEKHSKKDIANKLKDRKIYYGATINQIIIPKNIIVEMYYTNSVKKIYKLRLNKNNLSNYKKLIKKLLIKNIVKFNIYKV